MDDQKSQFNVEDLYGGNDCQEALHTLYHYLDGELTEERRQAISRHLSQCQSCLHAFDFEAELKVVVSRACRDQVPAHLKARIAQVIAEASGEQHGTV